MLNNIQELPLSGEDFLTDVSLDIASRGIHLELDMREEIDESFPNQDTLIKQCIAIDLALKRIEWQKELEKDSWNDWNLLFFTWPFSGKKVLLDQIDLNLTEIKTLEGNKSLKDLHEGYQLSQYSSIKFHQYELSSQDELSDTHAKLCGKYFSALRSLLTNFKDAPDTLSLTMDDRERIEEYSKELDSQVDYYNNPKLGKADDIVLRNKISDDLNIVDLRFKWWDTGVDKWISTIPPIKLLIYIAENIDNYFAPNAIKEALSESEIITEPATNEILEEPIGQHQHHD